MYKSLNYYVLIFCLSLSFFSVKNGYAQPANFKAILIDVDKNEKLNQIFSEFTSFSFQTKAFSKHVANRSVSDHISLQIDDNLQWEFMLEPISIISEETKIYTLGSEGKSLYPQPINVKSFVGTFADGREGSIRLTINGSFMYGMISSEGDTYYIEPLKYYVNNSREDQFIIYNSKHIKDEHKYHTCSRPTEDAAQIDRIDNGTRISGACYKAKLAVFADYLMYTDVAHPGVDAVIDHIVAVINNVQANYVYNGNANFNDGINFEISEIVVSTCLTCDPVSSQTNPNILLSEFSLWVDQNGFSNPFNAAHMWSNRDFNGSAVGMAFQSSNLLCTTKARAILQDWTTTAALLKTMVAHELGHNFNGLHDGSAGMVLSPTVSTTDTWSTTSKTVISTQISSQGPSCLTSCGDPACPKVENIVVSNVTNTNFTLSWSAASGGLYTIKVRNLGSTDFILDITTISTSLVVSPPGYGICKQYDVFVYNNCGSSGLSAVQRIFLKGPDSQGCADFISDKAVSWLNTTVNFIDKSINATSWFWDFGNGQTSTLQNPGVIYGSGGTYDVTLTVNNVHTMIKSTAVTVLPNSSVPFTMEQGGNFESNANYFASEAYEGIVNVWEYGTSNYALATQGNAWKSKLNSDIPQVNSKSALYTPKFNFTGYQNLTLSFDIGMETTFCNAPVAAQLQYSTNNGSTWSRLGDAPGFYNAGIGQFCVLETQIFSDKTGWALNSNYNPMSIDISFLAGQTSVIFRFVVSISGIYSSGYSVDGVLIDNVHIVATNPAPLPLVVGSLKARKIEGASLLTWNVYQPFDIKKYFVERSIDGINFYPIAEVDQDTPDHTDFEYYDRSPFINNNFYRIGAVSLNGSVTYSNTALLVYKEDKKVTIFPNPLDKEGFLNIYWNGQKDKIETISVIDALGQVIISQQTSNVNDQLYVDYIPTGLYYVKLTFLDGTIQPIRFIKL
ncbi:MAG: T9SS type A sorting domain-containing protein [Saprospiraceae bacterium]|nr:T9SS type A sorting domain-containing protein [Saprospiraceae bacterium]